MFVISINRIIYYLPLKYLITAKNVTCLIQTTFVCHHTSVTWHTQRPHSKSLNRQCIVYINNQYLHPENENNVSQIVDILGELDNVLDVFLSHSNNITMTQNQLYQLHQLFITPYKYRQSNKDTIRSLSKLSPSTDRDESHTNHDDMYYEFDISNTYFHAKWEKKYAEKVTKLLRCKMTHFIYFLVSIDQVVYEYNSCESIIIPILVIIVGMLLESYLMAWILSADEYGMKLLFNTFEFWSKIINVIVLITVHIITRNILSDDSNRYTEHYKWLMLTAHLVQLSSFF